MKKLLFSLLISASFTAFAQQSTLVTVDGNLASSSFMNANTKNIQSKKTYAANAVLPKSLSSFSDVSKKGLVAINLKERNYDTISLAQLNLQSKLDAKNPIMFDGLMIKNTEIIILSDVIKNAEVKMVDGRKVLNISI